VDRFPLVARSQLLRPPVSFGYCDAQPGFDAVVKAVKHPDQVWRSYVDQIQSIPKRQEQRGTIRGAAYAHYVDSYWDHLTRLTVPDGPTYILISNCGE
jgi:hypothetical protein